MPYPFKLLKISKYKLSIYIYAPVITFKLAQIVEASQMTLPQKIVDERPLFIPAGLQDEIVLYETNKAIEGE